MVAMRVKYGWMSVVLMAACAGMLTGCRPEPLPEGRAATPGEIRETIAGLTAPLTLVHVWATWCAPCREEFPDVLEVYRDTRGMGLELILVSADDPRELEAVNRFLLEQQSPRGSLVSTQLNEEFIQLFSPAWSGALPASFFFDAEGRLVAEWQGKRSYDTYRDTIERLLTP